jgi:hypothetical protein
MYDKFTDQQKDAVNAKGSVIVTAAAGSGKTAVLSERVIDRIKNENLSIDKMLIVTFTNLAAAEMKTRIEKRLYEECENHTQNIHLLKQKLLVSSADICTIDSFCIKLIRNNFSKLGISPDFKIADSKTELVLSQKVMSDIFREHFDSNDENFYDFLRSTDSIYSDDNASKQVLNLYNKVMSLPFYKESLDRMLLDYNPDDILSSRWFSYLFELVIDKFKELVEIFSLQKEEFLPDTAASKVVLTPIEEFISYMKKCITAAEKVDFEELRAVIINPPMKPALRAKFDVTLKIKAKALFKELSEQYSYKDSGDKLKEVQIIIKKQNDARTKHTLLVILAISVVVIIGAIIMFVMSRPKV